MGETLGLPLNWSWMHKPSVFLAVCQCERGGGSCRSGPGLNDGAHNLCFTRQRLCELWLILAHAALHWNKVGDGFCCRPTSPPSCQNSRVREAKDRLGESLGEIKWTDRMNEREKWGDGQKVCAESRREWKVYGWWVLCVSEWGSGALCASQSVAQWVRLSGAGAKDEGQRARRERWGQPAGLKRVEAWEKKDESKQSRGKLLIYVNLVALKREVFMIDKRLRKVMLKGFKGGAQLINYVKHNFVVTICVLFYFQMKGQLWVSTTHWRLISFLSCRVLLPSLLCLSLVLFITVTPSENVTPCALIGFYSLLTYWQWLLPPVWVTLASVT